MERSKKQRGHGHTRPGKKAKNSEKRSLTRPYMVRQKTVYDAERQKTRPYVVRQKTISDYTRPGFENHTVIRSRAKNRIRSYRAKNDAELKFLGLCYSREKSCMAELGKKRIGIGAGDLSIRSFAKSFDPPF